MICSRNCIEVIILDLAILFLGAVILPIDPRESTSGVSVIAGLAKPKLVVAHESSRETLKAAGLEVTDLARVGKALSENRTIIQLDQSPDAPAVLLTTSGTTSEPKLVCLSQYNLMANAEALRRLHQLRPMRATLGVLPLYHANAFGFSFIANLYAGAHLVLTDGLPLLALSRILKEQRASTISLAPELLRAILRRPFHINNLPDLSYVISAAAPLSVSLAQEFFKVTGTRIRQGYGLSECTNFACTLPMDLTNVDYARAMHDRAFTSIGPAVHACEVAIVDADMQPLKEGAEGQIAVRGHNVMLGYWNQPEATADALDRGYLLTGDMGSWHLIGGRRHISVTGRIKEVIIRYGDKISPAAAEAALASFALRHRSAIVGFNNLHAGQEIGLYVEGNDTPALRTEVLEAVAAAGMLTRPRAVVIAEEPIPRTSTGKVQRLRLSSSFSKGANISFGNGPVVFFGKC